MVAVTVGVAAELLRRGASNDHATLGTLLYSLCRSLAGEGVDEQLYEDLESVFGEYAHPTPREVTAIARRFRRAATKCVEVAPYSCGHTRSTRCGV